ncbi:MAG: hypothetical protein ABIS50_02395 [Luteolibacter sp.]|uniref:hypothetical protein n=1 Tax=Luteolibacter sp. TaxID=1962973 RepID=UPI003264FB41
MAREEKRIELKPVEESPVLKAPVVRLESVETQSRPKPVRLKLQGEETKVSQRLNMPSRDEFELRTHQPGIEVLIESDAPNPDLFEKDWGGASGHHKQIPWGWFVLIGSMLSGAVIWSLSQVNDSGSQAMQVREETATVLKKDAREEQEAGDLLKRIDTSTRRFFKATSIAEMLPLIRHPERVRPLMELYYAQFPVLPHKIVETRRLEPLTLDHQTNFWLSVLQLDDHKTRNLVLDVPDSGDPLIDWETLVCYQPMDWDTFARERPAKKSLDFRVYVEADNFYSHEFADSTKWTCFRLTALGAEESVFGYAKANEPLANGILDLVNRNQGRPCSLILRISIPEGLQSRSGAVIEKLMSPRWLYIDPPDSSS